MLKEFDNLRQDPGSFRRLFSDEDFDLYVWYRSEADRVPVGFQVVYNAGPVQKALTWREDLGFDHQEVDEGDDRINMSPILVADGEFRYDLVWSRLSKRLENIEPEIRILVTEKMEAFGK